MADQKKERNLLRGFPLFSILGFEVRLNLSWLLLGLLIAWTLAEGFFPQNYPDLGTQTRWWMGVAGAVGILLSIVFHELSHSLVARRYGLPMGGITLFIFGGIAEMRQEPKSPRVEFLMAVAGPVASFVLAGLVWLVKQAAESLAWPLPVIGVLHYLAIINVVLGVFNLIPAFPLDGGRMLRAGLWSWRKDLRQATHMASRGGSIFGLMLMFLGAVEFFTGGIVSGMWSFLIGAFIRGAASASWRQLLMREVLKDSRVGDLMDDNPIAVPRSASVREFVDDYLYRYPYRLYPVVDGGELVGCAGVDEVLGIAEGDREQRTVGDIASACSEATTASPDDEATELVNALQQPGAAERRFVVDKGRLVGAISLDGLRKLMSIRAELESKAA